MTVKNTHFNPIEFSIHLDNKYFVTVPAINLDANSNDQHEIIS